ncbi:hypothetical protein WJ971_18050 [Achromobacter xylosoxidans]
MYRPHAHHADQPAVAVGADEFVAAMRLPPHALQEFGFIEGGAQLLYQGKSLCPGGRFDSAADHHDVSG